MYLMNNRNEMRHESTGRCISQFAHMVSLGKNKGFQWDRLETMMECGKYVVQVIIGNGFMVVEVKARAM
jgi:hypothetical protein